MSRDGLWWKILELYFAFKMFDVTINIKIHVGRRRMNCGKNTYL